MSVTEEFRAHAERIVDDLLAWDPEEATALGDHRFDDRLPDLSAVAVDDRLTAVEDHLTVLDAIDDVELDITDLVDMEILRSRLQRAQYELREVRRTRLSDIIRRNTDIGDEIPDNVFYVGGKRRR